MIRTATCLVLVYLGLIGADRIQHSDRMFGQLISPNYPDTYPDNFDREWVVTVPQGFKVELMFQNFDMEYSNKCEYDYVKISGNENNFATLCGGEAIGIESTPGDALYTSLDNQLNVQFHADFSNELNFKGFLAHYRAIDINECEDQNGGCDHYCHNYLGGFYCSCRRGFELHSDLLSCTVECAGNILYSTEGIITSPEYPLPYPRQLQCDWTISVDSGYVINLYFLDFDIEEHPDVVCPYDFLRIESGGNTDGPLCGSVKPNNITTSGHMVKISLLSDGLRSGRGFKIAYTTTGKPCVEIEAPGYGTMTGDDFTFRSTVIFNCNDGYILKGSKARSCRADGNWSGEPTWCQSVDCGAPGNISHGSWTSYSNNFTLGNSVVYECDRFYDLTLESESTRTCNEEGNWIPEEPICEQICGESTVAPHPRPNDGRIVGGRTSVPGSWPWQALLKIQWASYSQDINLCGGMVINDQWILTAAHCLNDTLAAHGRAVLPTTAIKIYLGTNDQTSTDKQEVYAEKIVSHPEFDKEIPFDADIALIKLTQSLQFSSVIRPICLPEQANTTNDYKSNIDHFDKPSKRGVVIGWGKTSEYHASTNYLREVYVPLASRNTCRDAYRTRTKGLDVNENMVCAGEREGGRDSCRGDSGGPFMFRNDDAAYFVYGIVSWGNGCGRSGFYGVYTRVENYVDWIRSTVAGG